MLILQREALVSKSADVRRLIGKRLEMWEDGLYDALMHDAERCDRTFGHGNNARRQEQECAHTERIFHRLMIEGKVRSAVRWITERERGGLLKATDVTTAKDSHGQNAEMSVLEALRLKHPEPADPGVSQPAFLPYPAPPPMVDLDITGGHIKTVARWLRGGAGPGGSDSSAWQAWLLRFGGQSERLRDAVAQLARVIANGLVPWEVIRAIKPPDRFGQVSWSQTDRHWRMPSPSDGQGSHDRCGWRRAGSLWLGSALLRASGRH